MHGMRTTAKHGTGQNERAQTPDQGSVILDPGDIQWSVDQTLYQPHVYFAFVMFSRIIHDQFFPSENPCQSSQLVLLNLRTYPRAGICFLWVMCPFILIQISFSVNLDGKANKNKRAM